MGNNLPSPWNGYRVESLRKLWGQGYSCAQIASELGVTRNAVIGKAHRLNLPSLGREQNVNAQKRAIDPHPPATPRASPRSRTRTVFKSREIKPRLKVINPNAKPAIMTAVSVFTGQQTGAVRLRHPSIGEMTKNELRAMLTAAVQNTAAMQDEMA